MHNCNQQSWNPLLAFSTGLQNKIAHTQKIVYIWNQTCPVFCPQYSFTGYGWRTYIIYEDFWGKESNSNVVAKIHKKMTNFGLVCIFVRMSYGKYISLAQKSIQIIVFHCFHYLTFSALEVKSNLQSVQYLCLAWSSQTIAKKCSTSNESGRIYRGGSISSNKRNGTLFTYSSWLL